MRIIVLASLGLALVGALLLLLSDRARVAMHRRDPEEMEKREKHL